jgi:hypothetical protein
LDNVFFISSGSERVSGRKESYDSLVADRIDRVDLLTWTKHAVSSYRSDIQQNLLINSGDDCNRHGTLKQATGPYTLCYESSSSTMLDPDVYES